MYTSYIEEYDFHQYRRLLKIPHIPYRPHTDLHEGAPPDFQYGPAGSKGGQTDCTVYHFSRIESHGLADNVSHHVLRIHTSHLTAER
jgi:hypothetical protein